MEKESHTMITYSLTILSIPYKSNAPEIANIYNIKKKGGPRHTNAPERWVGHRLLVYLIECLNDYPPRTNQL
jgi:hypothetical protein